MDAEVIHPLEVAEGVAEDVRAGVGGGGRAALAQWGGRGAGMGERAGHLGHGIGCALGERRRVRDVESGRRGAQCAVAEC